MYRIISDTSCDLRKDEIEELNISYAPFKINIDGVEYVDDENLDLNEFNESMKNSKNPIRTSTPSPYEYLDLIEKNLGKDIYIVTISSKLSGSFNAAISAVTEAREKYENINVEIIDSKSATAGQTRVILKLLDILKTSDDFSKNIEEIRKFIDEQHTLFVLESMQNLIKNGRIKKTTGLIANVLNIRPIMKSEDGEIELYEVNRGMKKSMERLVVAIGDVAGDVTDRIIIISHNRAEKRAEDLKNNIIARYNPREVIIRQTNGLSSGYVNIGGVVIAF